MLSLRRMPLDVCVMLVRREHTSSMTSRLKMLYSEYLDDILYTSECFRVHRETF